MSALTRQAQGWIAGGAAAAVAIVAAGWFLVVSPQFAAADSSNDQLADAQTQNVVLRNRLSQLRDKAAHTDDLTAELAQVRAAIPPQHDLEGFTRQLAGFAQAAPVTITSISPAEPVEITLPAPTTAASDSGDASGTSSSAAAPTTAESGAPAGQTGSGAAGTLYSIAVTVVTTGDMAGQRAFLAAIETQGARRALVTSTAFSPLTDTGGDVPDSEVPDSGAAESGATEADPAGSDTTESDTPTVADNGAATTTTAPPASAAQWTLTTQLTIFVAPQSPGQDKALRDQLGGNG